MVKENLIPKTETVYEIKNKVPSFEEFMKSYEGGVNYADLNLYDISVDKCYGPGCNGYWPCGDSRCYGSNACLYNERFFLLHTPCPAARCPNQQQKNATYWVHDNPGCGNRGDLSRDKITNKLRIRCPDCFNTSHMKYHKFTCSAHKDRHWWTSSMSFSRAFSIIYGNKEIPMDVYLEMLADLRNPGNQWEAREDDE